MVLRGLMTAGLAFSLSCSDGRAPETSHRGLIRAVPRHLSKSPWPLPIKTMTSQQIRLQEFRRCRTLYFPLANGPPPLAQTMRGRATVVKPVEREDLPFEVEGIVTLHPRWYFKTHGCDDGDEKFYGSFFIQDGTSGIFVLGDSKVAHFDMGARVKMKVRGVRTIYDLNVVYAHDITEVVDYGPVPVYYDEATEALEIWRMSAA